MELDIQDLRWAIRRLPSNLSKIMEDPEWSGKIFVGGGYLRSIVSNESVNDVDVFVGTKVEAELLAYKLTPNRNDVIVTDNAYTVKGKLPIQIIHRWLFDKPEDVSNSFDFTVCCAVIWYNTTTRWGSYCDDRFYIDLAAKRLVYRSPIRDEEVGGSMLRVLKYYQKGYRIPMDSLGKVIARLVSKVNFHAIDPGDNEWLAKVVTGLLIEVDPAIDPLHNAHLPAQEE